jgi:hypothetical protein
VADTPDQRRATYLKHVSVHDPGPLFILQPSLRSEIIGVLAERLAVTVQHPAVDCDSRTGREEVAIELSAIFRGEASNVQSNGRSHTHRLAETCLEIG